LDCKFVAGTDRFGLRDSLTAGSTTSTLSRHLKHRQHQGEAMSPVEIVAILALTCWAVYQQTHVSAVTKNGRFKMAIIYGIVGLCVGGFDLPSGTAGIAMIAFGVALSVVVGLARGRLTRVWAKPDGTVYKQGTKLTVGLFLGMIAVKFALGAWAQIAHIDDGEGFGEVLVMLAVMLAVQAQIVWNRARALTDSTPTADPYPTAGQPLTSQQSAHR
jgi:hypothetical protein